MAAGETAWLSCRGLAGFASWQPGMPSGEAAWLPAPKLGFASWQGVMAAGEARGGPPLGPGPGPVDVGVQESWPTGAGGSMKRRRLSWPWAVGRQCVTRAGSGRVQGRRGSLDSFVQLSALNPQLVGDSTRWIRSTRSLHSHPSTRWVWFDSLAHRPVALGRWPRLGEGWRGPEGAGGEAHGANPGRPGGCWQLASWQRGMGGREAEAGRQGSNRARSAQLASWQLAGWRGGPLPQVRQEAPGAWRLARLGFCPRVGKGGSQE